ncbi:xanthine dehydrogenase accessory protein XdhC [Pseudoduganella sp. GCM10020061]|uniref:xanthine dehydrogenase accessory protein XdhC n=1 Tax=Pseudoduganella sp. GCM10020061 TaxID=3317345 RepID=UPI003630A42E
MDAWLEAAGAGPFVAVTVAAAEGSVPREPGAAMLVGEAWLSGTIGGGHLELKATEIARDMLRQGRERHIERFALGPGLGQCCGGVVHLAFEAVAQEQALALAARTGKDTWRLVAFDGAPDWTLCGPDYQPLDGRAEAPVFATGRGTHLMQDRDGRRWLVHRLQAPRAHLVLFGAGHVGAALVRALAPLPCTVTWVDERDDLFPAAVPANVRIEATDTPECIVAQAPGGSCYLVMTHSHALDQRLAEAILSRPGVGWFGLIGSKTKRVQFERRLLARGVERARIDALACPIGMPGITGKEPAVIAASVCAQLLAVWESQSTGTAPAFIDLSAAA